MDNRNNAQQLEFMLKWKELLKKLLIKTRTEDIDKSPKKIPT